MKAKFMIAPLISTIGYMLLSLSTPSILNAQIRDYGTTRQPRTCPTRSQPTNGLITPELATMYAICSIEKEIITPYSHRINFVDIQNLRVAPTPRAATLREVEIYRRIDTTKPVFDIRGNVTFYECSQINRKVPTHTNPNPGDNRGENCSVHRIPESNGSCYHNTFGEWYCFLSHYSLNAERKMPPPAN
jgi:hypothetical protein